jgi:hypothetical protein
MGVEIETAVRLGREQAAARVEQANADYHRLLAEHRESPAALLERDREALNRLRNDPYHLNRMAAGSTAAANEERTLTARIAVAESRVPQTEAQRIDAVISGQADIIGPDTSYGSQIPMRDLASGYGDVLARGVRPQTVKHFEETGYADDPVGEGRESQAQKAAEWNRKLMSDPEMQKKFLAVPMDPEIKRQFDYYGIYAPDPRKAPRE